MAEQPRTRPNFSPKDAIHIAQESFSILADWADVLPSERDQNFLLQEASSGRKYVMKLAQSTEDREILDFQNRILEHLGRRGFPLSKVLHARDGSEIVEVPGPGSRTYLTRLLTWVPGKPLCEVNPHTPDLFRSLGTFLGGMDKALEDFSHPAQGRELQWDLKSAGRVVRSNLEYVKDPDRRYLLGEMAGRFLESLGPLLPDLRISVIHGDANDHNILVMPPEVGLPPEDRRVVGILDFGDAVRSFTVGEAAIAAAYAMLGKRDPFPTAARVVEGYHRAYALTEAEIAALFPLMGLRLCASVAISAQQKLREPANEYLTVSEAPAWSILGRMGEESPEFPHFLLREACGLEPVPGARAVVSWLESHGRSAAPVVGRVAEPPDPSSSDSGSTDFGAATVRADPVNLSSASLHVFDFSVDSSEFGVSPEPADARGWTDAIFRKMKAVEAELGVGRYAEARRWYTSDIFRVPTDGPPEWRTIHLGIDLFTDPGSPVYTPFDAVVHSLRNNTGSLDYGPTVLLEHRFRTDPIHTAPGTGTDRPPEHSGTGEGQLRFWTLYGHLSEEGLKSLQPGQRLRRGEMFARVGAFPGNGNWAPHLHFQVLTDTLGFRGNFPGVARPSQRELWKILSPDPNLILGLPDPGVEGLKGGSNILFLEHPGPSEPGRPSGVPLSPIKGQSKEDILAVRKRHLGPNLSISYRNPLKIVRGLREFLFDEEGQAYLDCVNNVPTVGHSHPKVVEAGRRQMAILNTNTRYLHDLLAHYAARLVALLPEPLSVVYFVNSGSEANELALRMARTHTKKTNVLVVEGAYHGNTSALVDLSPYKFDGPGGQGPRAWVHKVPMPDPYRGLFRAHDAVGMSSPEPIGPRSESGGNGVSGIQPTYMPPEEVGLRYADEVRKKLNLMRVEGRAPAAFFCESMLGCGGQILLPEGYLREVFKLVRENGALCVADEVQVGFGRAGTHFWAFETQGVVPDIVTLGKPMGNGHPLGAVITTPAVARSFATGMEYFNTFGGNPVSCAIGLAVLDVIEEEGLQKNAREVGAYLLSGLKRLKKRNQLIGDVRGMGLFIGVELVRDSSTRSPARTEAERLKERLRDHRILVSTDGPQENVIKIKPPLVFTAADADQLVRTMGRILEEEEFLL